jgi:WXG100 family type VII secretion target
VVTVHYAVDLERLTEHVEEAQRFTDQVDEALSRLHVVVEQLHLTWTGRAADAHRRAHRSWASGAREMREGLLEMTRAAAGARAEYAAAARANDRMWSPLA